MDDVRLERLRPATDVEPGMLDDYFASLPSEDMDAGFGLGDVMATIWHRSLEAAWPSALRLARTLGREPGPALEGWKFRAVGDGNPWHASFVAEKEDGSGFLYTLVLGKERSEADRERRRAAAAEASSGKGPDEARAILAGMLIAEMREDDAASTADPAVYRDPAEVARAEEVMVHAYGSGTSPDHYDGYAVPLPELLRTVGAGGYAHGLVGTCRPTADELDPEPSRSSSDRCPETVAALLALSVLDRGLEAAGLQQDVRKRAREVSSWSYAHYGDARAAILAEAAQCAVYCDSGFAGPHSYETAWEYWKEAACHDLSRIAGQAAETAAMLGEGGHVSAEDAYSFNDLDDYAFAGPLAGGLTAVWLRTQAGGYGIVMRGAASGVPDHFSIARVDVGWGKAVTAISPDMPGFLGAFNAVDGDDGRRRFTATLMGRFTDRAVRDLNNILLTLDSAHCCLSEERQAAPAR